MGGLRARCVEVPFRPERRGRRLQGFGDAPLNAARAALPQADGRHRGRLHAQIARDLSQRAASQA